MILHRYIAKHIIFASAIVIFAVLGLIFFIDLLTELKDVGTGDYGFSQAVFYVVLRLPYDLYHFFPMLLLLGGVLGLGALSSNYELIVMRTAGMSVMKIMFAVVTGAIILIGLITFSGELVAPRAMFLADKQKQSAINGGQAVASTSGVWIHEGNNFLHIDRIIGKRHLEGVRRYEFDQQHRLLAAYFVRSMDFQQDQWLLHDLAKTTFQHDTTFSEFFPTSTWDLKLHPNLLNVGVIEPAELSMKELTNYSDHLIKNGLEATQFQFEFWKRIFQPFSTLVMILLALPFVFGSPRAAMGWRILFAVIVGFVFYILNAFLSQFSMVFQLSPFYAALFPTVLFGFVGYFFMVKN